MENQQQDNQSIPRPPDLVATRSRTGRPGSAEGGQSQPVGGFTPSSVEGPPKLYPEHSRGADKKLVAVVIAIVVILIAAVAIGAYYWWKSISIGEQYACTMEAKLCPDGSAVGRTGPNCEFAECPSLRKLSSQECIDAGGTIFNTLGNNYYDKDRVMGEVTGMDCPCVCLKGTEEPIDTSNWQTYRNETYNYDIKYPSQIHYDDSGYEMGNSYISYFPNEVSFQFSDIDINTDEVMLFIRIYPNDKEYSLDTWVNDVIARAKIYENKKITFAGIEAYQIIATGPIGTIPYSQGGRVFDDWYKMKFIYFKNGKNIYRISYPAYPIEYQYSDLSPFSAERIAIFERILSTFKFIN